MVVFVTIKIKKNLNGIFKYAIKLIEMFSYFPSIPLLLVPMEVLHYIVRFIMCHPLSSSLFNCSMAVMLIILTNSCSYCDSAR